MRGVEILFSEPGARDFASWTYWDPTLLGASLIERLSAADPSVGAVNPWVGKNSLITAAQATGSKQPVKSATGFNSAYPVVTADGVDDVLQWTSFTGLPSGSTVCQVWALVDAISSGATGVISQGGGTANGTFRQIRKNSTNTAQASDGTTIQAGTVGALVGPHLLMSEFNGTTLNSYLDGTAFASNPVTIGSLNSGTTRGALFATNATTPGSFFAGGLAEWALTTVLTTAQRQAFEGYLLWTNGLQALLPSNHPYKNARP